MTQQTALRAPAVVWPPGQTRKALDTFPCPSKLGTAVLAEDRCDTEGTSAFADTTLWMYLPVQDAAAPRENNNPRCLLVQAQLLHTALGWQAGPVLAEQAGTAAITVQDYCCGASGSLLDQPRQIPATCTCLCSQVYWTTLHRVTPGPCHV